MIVVEDLEAVPAKLFEHAPELHVYVFPERYFVQFDVVSAEAVDAFEYQTL